MKLAGCLIAAALLAASCANGAPVTIDSTSVGREFFGIGGLSGGGATSRLLPSYDNETKSKIMDYLFKPNFGASLHILKVEIGGDAQSTDGTEPSHQHTIDDLNCERGYEWYLLQQAKMRNPSIKTYGLSWAWPAWTGNFTKSPWNAINLAANYTINWLNCARHTYNIDIDYIGSWNERSYSSDYLKLLRQELDNNGFPNTKIVAPDSNWNIASDMLSDPDLDKAVYAIGAHYPGMSSSSDAQKTGHLLLSSEDDSTFGDNIGTACWARVLNRNYVQGLMSGTIMWNLLAAYQPGLPWMGTSFMWATQPWSGHYELKSAVHVTAHWTQFTQPGWFYLSNTGATTGGGSGFFAQGGTYASLVEKQDGSGAFSIIMEKIHHDRSKCVRPSLPEYDVAEEDVTFVLSGPAATLALSQGKLAYWLSTLRYNGEASTVFEQQTALTVTKGSVEGTAQVTLTVPVDSIITVSSILTGPSKGLFPDPPAQTDFPIPYSDNFDSYPLHSEPSYFADQAGSWEVLDTGDATHGLAMRQMVPTTPICWAGDFAPVSVFGEIAWTDVSHSIDFNIDPESSYGAAASIGARVTGTTRSHGVFVSVSTTNSWSLWYNLGKNETALSGTTPMAIKAGDWHTLSLTVKGSSATATIDGQALFSNVDISACNCPHGWTAVGTGWAYDFVWFDNYNIASATNNGVTCAKAAAGQSAILEGASTEHDLNFRYSYDTSTSRVSLLSDPSLCLGVQGVDPNSGSPNVGLVACASGDDGQQWLLQLNATTTQMVNQYKGMGYCLDITGGATNSGANAELYECNGGDNQKFVMDEDGRIINTGFTEPKKAVGACNPISQ